MREALGSLSSQRAAMQEQIKQLEQQLAAARVDSERLDWLASDEQRYAWEDQIWHKPSNLWRGGAEFDVTGFEPLTKDNFRAAIDAARKNT